MENEQKRVRFIDSTYILDEMISQFEDSNSSANKAIEEYQKTLGQLESIKKPSEAIKMMIEQMKKNIADVQEAARINAYRADCLRPVVLLVQQTKIGQDENVRFVLSMLLEAMGVVNRECKAFNDRTELKPDESTGA